MLIRARSGTGSPRQRGNKRNDSMNSYSDSDKTTRKAILLYIGKVLYTRLQETVVKYGVIRQTFNEYHQRYNWITERQVRHALARYKECLNVSSTDESVLETNTDLPERIIHDETTNKSNVHKVCDLSV